MPIPRSVLANFESGRRGTVSVAELLVLAGALDCPPVELIVPLAPDGAVELLPHRLSSAREADAWFTAPRRCPRCDNKPHPGYTCNECGRSG
jgi:hypothetical protein